MSRYEFNYDDSTIHASYNAARRLPARTIDQWMAELKHDVPIDQKRILDLGCGTGRFSSALAVAFDAPVIGVDPSQRMLDVASAGTDSPAVTFVAGSATQLPFDIPVSLVFMSMSIHYFAHQLDEVIDEVCRVLARGRHIAIRTVVPDDIVPMALFTFFPSARQLSIERLPKLHELLTPLSKRFRLVSNRLVNQRFAEDGEHYVQKIAARGLSSLRMIPDDEFQKGLRLLSEHVETAESVDDLIYERIRLIVFERID